MARFNPHHDNSKLYPAMREFATECLLRDGSVLQPGQSLWTSENLDELDRSFVQNPDAGDGKYYVKLGQQVAQGSPESRKLMAELHWLLFAFPSDITPSTKEERIREIWSWSGEDLPDAVPFLDHDILEGLGHTGQAYNNHRWRELNTLFENYVARLLPRALAVSGLRVVAQGGHRNCLFEEEVGRFRTKPDLIIRQGERVVMVIDTKWKRMTPQIDDPKQGVSQGDVYQLMAYSQLYDCPNVMLLYPHHGELPPDPICLRYAIGAKDAEAILSVATLNVTGASQQHVLDLKRLIDQSLSIPTATYPVLAAQS